MICEEGDELDDFFDGVGLVVKSARQGGRKRDGSWINKKNQKIKASIYIFIFIA